LKVHHYGILIGIALVLDTSLGPFLRVRGATPDFLLLVALAAAMRLGPGAGLRMGFFAGLMEDLLLGRFVGLNALANGGVACLAGLSGQKVFRDSLPVLVLVGFAASLASQIVILSAMGLAGYAGLPTYTLLRTMVCRALYNALLLPLFSRGLRRFRSVPSEPGGI
jgi:rod shape-determining protein MreD